MLAVRTIRMFVTLAVRGTAVVLILLGVYAAVQAALLWHWTGALNIRFGSGDFSWFGHALGYLLPGITLAIASGPLVRWLVPVARNECPQCGYALKELSTPRCPECGLAISEANLTDGPTP